ncbi:hypothetical protein GCM10009624_07230 [Gordonia sinesedis]
MLPSGTLQLSAVMRDTGVPVAGIGVQVYTPDPVAVTTPASLRAATPNVSFVVTTVPEGLQLVGPRQVTVPIRAGEASSYVFQLDDGNRPPAGHGTIRVTARDVTHDTALPGVTVSVGGPEVNQSLRLPASITGRPGTYLVTVTGVPRGYRLVQHGAATVTLAAGQTVTREFQFAADDSDGPSGTIAITKKNRVTGAALAGAGFAVAPCGGGEVIARVTTGTDGTAATDVRPGCYRVAETVAPAGYVAEYISYETWVVNGRTASLTVYNLPNGHVSTRDVERRVPLRSIPSGPVTRP